MAEVLHPFTDHRRKRLWSLSRRRINYLQEVGHPVYNAEGLNKAKLKTIAYSSIELTQDTVILQSWEAKKPTQQEGRSHLEYLLMKNAQLNGALILAQDTLPAYVWLNNGPIARILTVYSSKIIPQRLECLPPSQPIALRLQRSWKRLRRAATWQTYFKEIKEIIVHTVVVRLESKLKISCSLHSRYTIRICNSKLIGFLARSLLPKVSAIQHLYTVRGKVWFHPLLKLTEIVALNCVNPLQLLLDIALLHIQGWSQLLQITIL